MILTKNDKKLVAKHLRIIFKNYAKEYWSVSSSAQKQRLNRLHRKICKYLCIN